MFFVRYMADITPTEKAMLTDRNWPLVSRLVFTCAAAEQPNSFAAQRIGKQRRGSKAEIHYIPCCILYTILMKLQVCRKEKLTTPNRYCKLKCDYVIFMAWWIALEKKIGLRWLISFLWTLTYNLNGWNANFWLNLINKKQLCAKRPFQVNVLLWIDIGALCTVIKMIHL